MSLACGHEVEVGWFFKSQVLGGHLFLYTEDWMMDIDLELNIGLCTPACIHLRSVEGALVA